MPTLIQDIIPAKTVKRLPSNDVLIAVLYIRGATIQQIFGKFFEFDEHASAVDDGIFQVHRQPMTVGDAELAGHASLPTKPKERQPF